MSNVLDEKLFNALMQVQNSDGVLVPKSDSDKDREAFNELVLSILELIKLDYLEKKGEIKDSIRGSYYYYRIDCNITYRGKKALSYEDYDFYKEALSKDTMPYIMNNIISIEGNVNNSSITSGLGNNIHTENLTIQLPMNEIKFLIQYAEKNGISISELVHRYIRQLQESMNLSLDS